MQTNSSSQINIKSFYPLLFPNYKFKEVVLSNQEVHFMNLANAYKQLNQSLLKEAISKEIASFHSYGLHKRKYEKRINGLMISLYEDHLQLSFEGF